MGMGRIFPSLWVVTELGRCQALSDWLGFEELPGNSSHDKTVPETDTGGLVEYTKALERMMLKELGKLLP
jgi:hypothetical protein